MIADALLSRLEAVRQTGAGRWRAKCPSHDGKNREVLSIGETTDGTVLLKCFHGCTAAEVVAAIGLELSDLFPRVEWQTTGTHHARPRPMRVDWPALIVACERDLILVKIMLGVIARGEPISTEDAAECQVAATRTHRLIQEQRDIDAAYARAALRAREREKENEREAVADSAIAKRKAWATQRLDSVPHG